MGNSNEEEKNDSKSSNEETSKSSKNENVDEKAPQKKETKNDNESKSHTNENTETPNNDNSDEEEIPRNLKTIIVSNNATFKSNLAISVNQKTKEYTTIWKTVESTPKESIQISWEEKFWFMWVKFGSEDISNCYIEWNKVQIDPKSKNKIILNFSEDGTVKFGDSVMDNNYDGKLKIDVDGKFPMNCYLLAIGMGEEAYPVIITYAEEAGSCELDVENMGYELNYGEFTSGAPSTKKVLMKTITSAILKFPPMIDTACIDLQSDNTWSSEINYYERGEK